MLAMITAPRTLRSFPANHRRPWFVCAHDYQVLRDELRSYGAVGSGLAAYQLPEGELHVARDARDLLGRSVGTLYVLTGSILGERQHRMMTFAKDIGAEVVVLSTN